MHRHNHVLLSVGREKLLQGAVDDTREIGFAKVSGIDNHPRHADDFSGLIRHGFENDAVFRVVIVNREHGRLQHAAFMAEQFEGRDGYVDRACFCDGRVIGFLLLARLVEKHSRVRWVMKTAIKRNFASSASHLPKRYALFLQTLRGEGAGRRVK